MSHVRAFKMAANKSNNRKKAKANKVEAAVADSEKDIEMDLMLEETVDEKESAKREKDKMKSKSGFMSYLKGVDSLTMTCFVVMMLAFVVVIGAHINATYISAGTDNTTALTGDTVEVDYVGSYFGYYDETGAVVFDTNMKDVSNGSYAKAPSFTNKSTFEALSFKVGGTDVLKKFGDAVIGHKVGDVVKVTIAPADGYGVSEKKDYSKTVVYNMGYKLTLDEFNAIMDSSYKASDLSMKTMESPFKGIDMMVNYNSDSEVTIEFLNVKADTTGDSKIDSNVSFKVTSVVGQTFTVEYDFKTDNDKMFLVIDNECNPIFVDYEDEKFTYKVGSFDNANKEEQKGEDLYFYIKITKITAA